jgi:hypothetical protein
MALNPRGLLLALIFVTGYYSVHPRKGRVVLSQLPHVLWASGCWHYERTLYSRRPPSGPEFLSIYLSNQYRKTERCQHVSGWTWKHWDLDRSSPKISSDTESGKKERLGHHKIQGPRHETLGNPNVCVRHLERGHTCLTSRHPVHSGLLWRLDFFFFYFFFFKAFPCLNHNDFDMDVCLPQARNAL